VIEDLDGRRLSIATHSASGTAVRTLWHADRTERWKLNLGGVALGRRFHLIDPEDA